MQISAALNGDIDGERLRKTKGEADKLELENRRRKGELIEVDRVIELIQRICFTIRQTIMLSPLSNDDKAKTLTELQRLRDLNLATPLPDESD